MDEIYCVVVDSERGPRLSRQEPEIASHGMAKVLRLIRSDQVFWT